LEIKILRCEGKRHAGRRLIIKIHERRVYKLQEQINDKSVSLIIRGSKLTAQTLEKAMRQVLTAMKKQHKNSDKSDNLKIYKGKQTVQQLVGQNQGVNNIEISDGNIKSFERVARKYGVDFALKKDTSEKNPKWIVFFKAKDSDAITAAFKEYGVKMAKKADKSVSETPSLSADLAKAKEAVRAESVTKDKEKNKNMEISL
jgi:hypothetical protein